MIKKVLLLLCLSVLFVSCSSTDTISFNSMDTFMTIKCTSPNTKRALNMAMGKVMELEGRLSTTLEVSDIYRINHEDGKELRISKDTLYLIKESLKMAEESQGAFNPCLYPITKAWGFTTKNYTVPSNDTIQNLLQNIDYRKVQLTADTIKLPKGMELDLGAIAKGYTGDQIIRVLRFNGAKNGLINLGGNVQAFGRKNDGSKWKIGIKSPWDTTPIGGISIEEGAVITSGGYERFFKGDDGKDYIHIFDGKTGYPVNTNLVSSTIVASSGMYADALSTTTFVLGLEKSIELYHKNKDFDMILIFEDNSICYTKGLEGKLNLTHKFDKVSIIK